MSGVQASLVRPETPPAELPAGLRPAPQPLLTRLLAPAGLPQNRLFRHGAAAVLALPGRYSVTYLAVSEGAAAAFDVGSIADVPRVQAALVALGLGPGALRYVIPSHLHFDHAMGLDRLACDTGAAVLVGRVSHDHVTLGRPLRFPTWRDLPRGLAVWALQGLPFPPLSDWRDGCDFGMPWGHDRFRAPLAPPCDDGQPVPGLPGWTLLATPGHADDGVCLHHAAAGWLLAGDFVRNYLGGEWNPFRCDLRAFDDSRARLRALPLRAVFPAHGPVLSGPDPLAGLRDVPPYLP